MEDKAFALSFRRIIFNDSFEFEINEGYVGVSTEIFLSTVTAHCIGLPRRIG